MGLFGGGNSSSTQLTTQNDNRNVLGQGATLAQAGATIFQTTLDADVANHAIDASRLSTAEALGFGSDALASAFSFGKQALTTSTNSQAEAFSGALFAIDKNDNRAFNFGGDALASAFDFANDAAKRENTALDQTTSVLSTAYSDAKGRGALTDKILIGAIAMAGLVAYAAIKK